MCLREQLTGLRLRGIRDLGALALRLDAVALDLGLALLQLALLGRHLLLRALQLRGGCVLSVALERVGELRGRADQVESVHANGVTRGVDVRRLARGLQNAKLRLELRGMAPEGVERVAHALLVEALARAAKLINRRQRSQRRYGRTL
ncbi:MAG: hypothetical protein H0V45_06795 [Actinobacteria bacterium]|nr:hypothetical protein [Actinomycetota bacterium]